MRISLLLEACPYSGLAPRAGGQGFLLCPAPMSMITSYFYEAQKKTQNPPTFLASCLIPHHLLIAYTQQLEILVPALPYCYLDPQKPSKKDVVWITILILPSVGVTQ